MPAWIAKLVPLLTKTPWGKVFAVATWAYTVGKSRLEKNLTKKERGELTKLMTKSKGKPSNLSEREQTRFRRLVNKAVTGHLPS